eukprot:Tamp_25852.p1 GENE.Tamp_25852~~Tamp_25852.p1  ORF type:complete len:123 (-),score=12.57 Tamp_25852:239-607(-)
MLSACCKTLNAKGTAGPPKAIVEKLFSMHEKDVLTLPGSEQCQMVNFRRNPVDSPWAGELHQVLLNKGVLPKMRVSSSLLSASASADGAGLPAGGGGGDCQRCLRAARRMSRRALCRRMPSF